MISRIIFPRDFWSAFYFVVLSIFLTVELQCARSEIQSFTITLCGTLSVQGKVVTTVYSTDLKQFAVNGNAMGQKE